MDSVQQGCKIIVSVWPGLGDVVFATPVFEALRDKMPDAKVTALVWSKGGKELLKNNPFIDDIVEGSIFNFVSKFKNYDIGIQCSQPVQLLFMLAGIKQRISFNGNPLWWLYPVDSNNLHSYEYYLKTVTKIDGTEPKEKPECNVFLSESDEKFAKEELKKIAKPIVAIHPGARCNKNKRWGTDNFVELAKALIGKYNAKIIFIGGKEDVALSNYIKQQLSSCSDKIIDFTGKISILQSAAIIKNCNLFIGNASGPTHIAAAIGTPVIAIYGADNPVNFSPPGKKVKVITPTNKCAPCFHFYRNFFWGMRLRYIPTCRALKTIKVETVLNVCKEILEN
ncbi:MAG: glycosyltransferase family 9 protein [bacterium]|nr:glycosyltransferase family 9 protein [bacterium]